MLPEINNHTMMKKALKKLVTQSVDTTIPATESIKRM